MTPAEIVSQIERHLAQAAALTQGLRSALAAGAPMPALPRLAEPLRGDRWTERTARASVGILVRHARAGSLLTYGDLHREVASIGGQADVGTMQKYSKPLDNICRALAEVHRKGGKVVPVLTVLVINGRDKLPSVGVNPHVWNWLRDLGKEDLARDVPNDASMPGHLFDFALKAVREFEGWDEAVAAIGLTGDPATDLDRN